MRETRPFLYPVERSSDGRSGSQGRTDLKAGPLFSADASLNIRNKRRHQRQQPSLKDENAPHLNHDRRIRPASADCSDLATAHIHATVETELERRVQWP